MPDEEKIETSEQDKQEEAAWVEATKKEATEEEATEDKPKEEPEEEEEKEEAKEKPVEKKEDKTDWEAETKKFQQEAEAHKRLAEDLLRQKAEADKKAREDKEKADKEADEKVPEEIQAYLEEFPEAQKAIEHFGGIMAKKAINEFVAAIKEATDGEDPVEFLKKARADIGQFNFERDVMLGFADVDGTFIKGHPDVLEITRTPEFHDRLKKELKDNQSFKENDQKQAIQFITTYKKELLDKATAEDKEKLNKEKEDMEESMHATVGDSVRKGKKKEPDKNDEDAAWEEAMKMEAAI